MRRETDLFIDETKLSQLAERFRTPDGPDIEMATYYLVVSTRTLLNDLKLDEGMFGREVWFACEALKIRGEETPLSKWLDGDRKGPIPCPVEMDEKPQSTLMPQLDSAAKP